MAELSASTSFYSNAAELFDSPYRFTDIMGRNSHHFFSFRSLAVFTAKRWIRSPCLTKFLSLLQFRRIVIGVKQICRHRGWQSSADIFRLLFAIFTIVRQNHYQCFADIPLLQQFDRIICHAVPICCISIRTAEPFVVPYIFAEIISRNGPQKFLPFYRI